MHLLRKFTYLSIGPRVIDIRAYFMMFYHSFKHNKVTLEEEVNNKNTTSNTNDVEKVEET